MIRILSFVLLAVLLISCKGKKEAPSATIDIQEQSKPVQTQALLLVQSHEFDPAQKNNISGDYGAKAALVVPQNLAAQSKWIMFEGPVLENDLVAYRYYADSRHRFDIYGKTVSDLVMDTVSWDYHDIKNWGSDILKVGNSLGIGSPAIYFEDSLYTLSDCSRKEIEIVQNGPQASMIRTIFTGLNIAGQQFDLVQDWSIRAGQPYATIKLKVVNGELPEGMQFATGIVKHLPEVVVKSSDAAFYAMNWGIQTFHDDNMGMAIVAPEKYQPAMTEDQLNHLVLFGKDHSEVEYSFVSVWERDLNKVTTAEAFMSLVTNIKTQE